MILIKIWFSSSRTTKCHLRKKVVLMNCWVWLSNTRNFLSKATNLVLSLYRNHLCRSTEIWEKVWFKKSRFWRILRCASKYRCRTPSSWLILKLDIMKIWAKWKISKKNIKLPSNHLCSSSLTNIKMKQMIIMSCNLTLRILMQKYSK